jgi:multidrug resistance efflux pump
MRGRWASAAIGAGIARNRAGREMESQQEAFNAQQQQAQQQIEAQQRQIEALQQQKVQQQQQQPQPQSQTLSLHDDITEKLKKYGELKQQGLLTEEEFQKIKMDLLAKI